MSELLIIFIIGVILVYYSSYRPQKEDLLDNKNSFRVSRLWDIAHDAMKENRFLRAEKALLTILKIEEKNAAAYNRLGVLYAKRKEYKDAIDCFEIASSIDSSPASLHNLGLIYFETENYDKALIAFEQAIKLESNLATRHVAYAKVLEKIGNNHQMISELEEAARLEPNRQILNLLHKAYKDSGDMKKADRIAKRIQKINQSPVKIKPLKRPRKVVV